MVTIVWAITVGIIFITMAIVYQPQDVHTRK
jgi:hypothetical protein